MRYLLIGKSISSIACAEAIREIDKNGEILIITQEKQKAYGRPLISYKVARKIEQKSMFLRDDSFYEKYKIDYKLDTKVTKIDFDNKSVFTSTNENIHYDKLLISAGGTPIIPEIENINDKRNVSPFIDWENMLHIDGYIDKIKRACVIGGGLIGLKAAEALISREIEVTLIEKSNRILPTILDDEGAKIFHKNLKNYGVNLLLNTTVTAVDGDSYVQNVTLSNGNTIPTDLLIVAIGVKPNLEIVNGSVISTNTGIIVDRKMKTNIEDVYAAGDIAEAYDKIYDEVRISPIWPSAFSQGRIAGINMAGGNTEHEGTCIMNSISFIDTPVISYGIANPEEKDFDIVTKFDEDRNIYKRLNIKNNKLLGAIFVNNFYRKGIVSRIIQEGIDVSNLKDILLKDDLGFIDFPIEIRKIIQKS